MQRSLTFVLIAALGVFTVGCETKTGTTEDKIQTTTTQTKDGKITGETTTTRTDTTTTTPSDDRDAGAATTERTTETTTETTVETNE